MKLAIIERHIHHFCCRYLEEPTRGNWTFLDAALRADDGSTPSRLVASCSTPNTPPMLYLGTVADGGWFDSGGVQWQKISSNQTSTIDEVNWEVMTFDTQPVKYEAILLSPKHADKSTPLIVMPHGGPHSVTTIGFSAYNAAFVSLGYSIPCPSPVFFLR